MLQKEKILFDGSEVEIIVGASDEDNAIFVAGQLKHALYNEGTSLKKAIADLLKEKKDFKTKPFHTEESFLEYLLISTLKQNNIQYEMEQFYAEEYPQSLRALICQLNKFIQLGYKHIGFISDTEAFCIYVYDQKQYTPDELKDFLADEIKAERFKGLTDIDISIENYLPDEVKLEVSWHDFSKEYYIKKYCHCKGTPNCPDCFAGMTEYDNAPYSFFQ